MPVTVSTTDLLVMNRIEQSTLIINSPGPRGNDKHGTDLMAAQTGDKMERKISFVGLESMRASRTPLGLPRHLRRASVNRDGSGGVLKWKSPLKLFSGPHRTRRSRIPSWRPSHNGKFP